MPISMCVEVTFGSVNVAEGHLLGNGFLHSKVVVCREQNLYFWRLMYVIIF